MVVMLWLLAAVQVACMTRAGSLHHLSVCVDSRTTTDSSCICTDGPAVQRQLCSKGIHVLLLYVQLQTVASECCSGLPAVDNTPQCKAALAALRHSCLTVSSEARKDMGWCDRLQLQIVSSICWTMFS